VFYIHIRVFYTHILALFRCFIFKFSYCQLPNGGGGNFIQVFGNAHFTFQTGAQMYLKQWVAEAQRSSKREAKVRYILWEKN